MDSIIIMNMHVLIHVEDLLLCTNYCMIKDCTDKLKSPNHHFTLLHNSLSD